MKKILVIPIMLVYLLAMSGVMIYLHYCGKTLESWSFYAKSNGCSEGECGDEKQKSDDCCKDKVIASKISQDQHIADVFKLKLANDLYATLRTPVFFASDENPFIAPAQLTSNLPNAPPGLWQNIPLYKLHLSFTYYG